MSKAGGLFGGLIEEAILGTKKPKVPPKPHVDPQQAQLDSIRGNQAALPYLEDLGSDYNDYQLEQRRKFNRAIPGYDSITEGLSSTLDDWAHGRVSKDVGSFLHNRANARAQGGGYGGWAPGGMLDFLDLRNYGRTSQDQQELAQRYGPAYLQSMNAMLPRQFDPIGSFIDPARQIATQEWNEEQRFGRDWMQNQLDVMPTGFEKALASTIGNIADPTSGVLSLVGDVYGAGGGQAADSYAQSLAADYGGEMAAGGGAGAAASGGGY